uniref:DNA-directed RNA polymerase III subunit RPC9 n=1 Tax=Davidia involucrata TaxID=16924 RepID=A0A5B6YNU1_DAVIN
MKILKANCGALTNFEVLDFLRSRGAAKDPTRVIAPIAPSEWKVYDYLEQSVACNQTRESIKEFSEKCKKYKLATAEVINIINVRPSSVVEIDPIIEECDTRMGEGVEDLVEMVMQVLPSPPTRMESDGGTGKDKEESNEQQMEAS